MTATGDSRPRRVVLVFVDGLGWGDDDPGLNPTLSYGGDLFAFAAGRADGAALRPIDQQILSGFN